jgi:hypothetical protein
MSCKTLIASIRASKCDEETIQGYKSLCKWLERNKPTSKTDIENLIQTLHQHLKTGPASLRIAAIKTSGYLFKHGFLNYDGTNLANYERKINISNQSMINRNLSVEVSQRSK